MARNSLVWRAPELPRGNLMAAKRSTAAGTNFQPVSHNLDFGAGLKADGMRAPISNGIFPRPKRGGPNLFSKEYHQSSERRLMLSSRRMSCISFFLPPSLQYQLRH